MKNPNRKMSMVLMMVLMMIAVSEAFPENDVLKNFKKIEVEADVEDSKILCKDDKLDIAFIIDTSRSIHANEYDKQIEFIIRLVSIFNIGPENIRVAAISFGQEVVRDSAFGFSRYKTKEKVLVGIKGIVYRGKDMGDQTETALAIAFARKNIFSNTRPGVKKICVVLTDGRSTKPLMTKQEASYAKKDGIKMIAVGIGKNVSMEELKAIASNGNLVFKIDSYEDLPEFDRHVMTKTCENLYNIVNDTEIIIDYEGEDEGPSMMIFTTTPKTGPEDTTTTIITVPTPLITTSKPLGDEQPCSGLLLDINIMFRPSSVPPHYVLKLIENIVSAEAMEMDLVRVGLITIPTSKFKGFYLNHYRSKGEIREHFKTYHSTFTLTPSLLDLRAKAFHKLNGARREARKVAILLIDEKVTDIESAVEEAKFAFADGIEIFVISLASINADDSIIGLVDNKRMRIVHASLYSDLPYVADFLVRKICE